MQGLAIGAVILWLVVGIFSLLIVIAPLVIWNKLSHLIDETKRHNRKMEAKMDNVISILSELATPQEEGEE